MKFIKTQTQEIYFSLSTQYEIFKRLLESTLDSLISPNYEKLKQRKKKKRKKKRVFRVIRHY